MAQFSLLDKKSQLSEKKQKIEQDMKKLQENLDKFVALFKLNREKVKCYLKELCTLTNKNLVNNHNYISE